MGGGLFHPPPHHLVSDTFPRSWNDRLALFYLLGCYLSFVSWGVEIPRSSWTGENIFLWAMSFLLGVDHLHSFKHHLIRVSFSLRTRANILTPPLCESVSLLLHIWPNSWSSDNKQHKMNQGWIERVSSWLSPRPPPLDNWLVGWLIGVTTWS